MNFKQALESLKLGNKIKRKHWSGYWILEGNNIVMYGKDGRILDIRESEDMLYTLTNIVADDWEIASTSNSPLLNDILITTFSFGEAIRNLKSGKKLARKGWNGKDLFIVYQKGYPQGIPCNKQTAEAWGLNEGDLFRCEPYLQIKMSNGSHSMWTPSINDCLSDDWYIVD